MSISVRMNGRDKSTAPVPLDWPYLTAVQRALRLAKMGYPVVPSSSKTKNNRHPTVNDWQREATVDGSKILGEWGNRWTDTVGIVVGTGDVWGIDWDEPDRFPELLKLLPKNSGRVRTGSGGLHSYLRHDDYSRERLAALPPSTYVKGHQRDKAVELFATAPHSFLCPGTRHYRTDKLYTWEVERGPSVASHKFINALLKLPWEQAGHATDAHRAQFVSDNTILVREDIDVSQLFSEAGFETVKLRDAVKFIGRTLLPCPVAGEEHRSRSTWCLFYDARARTLRFYCASCKQGDTRQALAALGIGEVEDVDRRSRVLLTDAPVRECLPRLIELLRDSLYVYAGSLCRVTQHRNLEHTPKNRLPAVAEMNVIVPVNETYLRRALSEHKVIWKATRQGEREADAPTEWCEQLLDTPRTEPDVTSRWRPLHMLSQTPLLLPSGEVVRTPGYHAETGVYMDFDPARFPALPSKLTRQDALKALERFDPVFQLYPFVNADDTPRNPRKSDVRWWETPSGAVVLSTVLTLLAKHQLPRVPITGIDAPKPGYGKTDIVQSIAGSTMGHGIPHMTYEDDKEFAKSLLQLFERGDRLVLVDNVGETFVSNALAAATTSEEQETKRVLGEYRHLVVRNNAVFCVTGNNLRFGGDLATRRVIRARLDEDVEHPELRNFLSKPHPPTYAKQHFEQLAVAGLTILSAYIQAGKPQPAKQLDVGSFREWNELVRGCLLWLGAGDPWLTARGVAEDDPFYESGWALLDTWYRHLGERPYRLRDLEEYHKTLYTRLFGTDPKKSSTTSVGMRLGHLVGDTRKGYRLVRINSEGHGAQYSVQWRGKAKDKPTVDYEREDKKQFIEDYIKVAKGLKKEVGSEAIAAEMRAKNPKKFGAVRTAEVRLLAKEMGITFEGEQHEQR